MRIPPASQDRSVDGRVPTSSASGGIDFTTGGDRGKESAGKGAAGTPGLAI